MNPDFEVPDICSLLIPLERIQYLTIDAQRSSMNSRGHLYESPKTGPITHPSVDCSPGPALFQRSSVSIIKTSQQAGPSTKASIILDEVNMNLDIELPDIYRFFYSS